MTPPPVSVTAFRPAVEHLETVLRGIRTGRASTGLVEHVEIEVYGATLRLRDAATLTTPDARTIQIEPWDKSQVLIIAKTLSASPLGIHPTVAGSVIRLTLPPLTEERRTELTRLVGHHVEEARIAVRTGREKLLKELRAKKDEGEFSEDMAERERKRIQADVDAAIMRIEEHGRAKEQEIVSVDT